MDSFRQLSSLQQLNLQYDYSVHVPLEALSSFNNLQVLGISCRRLNNKMYLDGSFGALPRSITRLQFLFCDKDEVEPALMLRDLTCLELLHDLDLSHCITAFGSSGVCAIMNDETAQPAASCASLGLCTQLTRLILTNARLIIDVTLELLAFSALRVLCLRHAISLPNPGTIQVGLKDLVHSMRHLAELDIRQCHVVDMSPPDCEEMSLSCLSFDYQRIKHHDKSWLNHFVVHEQDSEALIKPFLRMYCDSLSQCDV